MSWYLPEKQVLFLHVPRTGGTWIKEAMFQAGISMVKGNKIVEPYRPKKHTIISYIRPDILAQVRVVFAFVRHPVSYYISIWRLTTRGWALRPDRMKWMVSGHNDPTVINEAILRWKPDFGEWLDEMLEEEPGWATRWFERFVGPPRGEFCHFIGRMDTIEQDTKDVLTMIGYGDQWNENREQIAKIHHAKNRLLNSKAPNIEVTDEQRARIERSERVLIRRFFGKDTFEKRVYRNFETGEPV